MRCVIGRLMQTKMLSIKPLRCHSVRSILTDTQANATGGTEMPEGGSPRRDKTETVQVGLRLKEPLRKALDEAARQRRVSMNAEIVARLERSFEAEDRFGGSSILPIVNMLAGAFVRGGQLGAAAQGHPEWTP